MARPDGGLIAGYTAPTVSAAKGTWTLRDSFQSQRQGSWPVNATDPYWSSVALLLSFDGTGNSFVDSSPNALAVTANGSATQSTAQSKFGGSSGFFNQAANTYLSIANNSALNIGTGEFTIEWWWRPAAFLVSTNETTPIAKNGADAWANAWGFDCGSTNLRFYLGNTPTDYGGAHGMTLNNWHHVAATRDSSNFCRLYVNGAQKGSGGTNTTSMTNTNAVTVGSRMVGGVFGNRLISGYIDELRITVGTARYVGATSFTVPPLAFPRTQGEFAKIPVMTSPTAPSGTVSDSGILSAGTPSWHAFNKATVSGDTTFYASPSPTTGNWIQYDYGYPIIANGYQITSRQLNPYGSTQAPPSWTLSGSEDGTNFTTVDTRTSQTWLASGERRSFALSQARRYRYWRWTWTSEPSAGAVVLAKIQLTG